MSKTSVGEVYDKVIKTVIEQSQVDFEEGGVDQSTLKLLQSEWQKKLSQLKVTQLPWDPAPPPPAQPVPPTVSDRKPPPQPAPLPSNGNPVSTNPIPNAQPRIKQEPGTFPAQAIPSNSYPLPLPQAPQNGGNIAQQRAALLLQQQYGARANTQINQLQQGTSRIPPQALPQQIPMKRENQEPQIKREGVEPVFKQEKDQKAPMSLQNHPNLSQQHHPPVSSSQLDGSSDDMQTYRIEIARRREIIALQRQAGDKLFREHLQESQQKLQGGGLMVPLEERYMPPSRIRQQVHALEAGEGSSSEGMGTFRDIGCAQSSLSRAQGDANGDDDDDAADEDAINSDLDDPDDLGEENNEEETDQVMLCTYDKVARVKNKWKCTLKDGILRVDGSEYVFHKGQGEFEW